MKNSELTHYTKHAFRILFVLAILLSSSNVLAQTSESSFVYVKYLSTSGVNIDELLSGKSGVGVLVYSLSETGILRLAVRLSNSITSDNIAIAEVFELPSTLQNAEPSSITSRILDDLQPKVILRSLDGNWSMNGHPSYNLDISLYGPSYSMWGSGYDPTSGFQSWAAHIIPDVLAVNIQVRDIDSDGLPDWDLRQLVPDYKYYGYIRTSYSERKCDAPTVVDEGVFPAWPYVASSGEFEQTPGQFRPPIVVDWNTGKIIYFSELVTARDQNCSYTVYSLDSLESGEINSLDYETPFAFYDLSGQGVGYPNLVLRTQRFSVDDPWIPANGDPYELIRYSWRDNIGDWLWDYKVEVMGDHPYTFQTLIAGGQYLIDAPPYEEFPAWVKQNPWPLVTFVDTEGNSYKSSEGLYDWSPGSLGLDYYSGWTADPDLTDFQTIRDGLRGEYRISEPSLVILYFSPVDDRLHLQGAQSGLFNLDGVQQLREYNLNGDVYIDGWVSEPISNQVSTQAAVYQGLFDLGDKYLFYDASQVRIIASEVPQSQFELYPPTDPSSWAYFRHIMEQDAPPKKDPSDLSTWLPGLGNQLLEISHATVSQPEYAGGIYRFELDLQPGFIVSGQDLLHLSALAPGRYAVYCDGNAFTIQPFTQPQLSLTLTSQFMSAQQPEGLYQLSLAAANSGTQDGMDLQLLLNASCSPDSQPLLSKSVSVSGNDRENWSLVWQHPSGKACRLSASLAEPSGIVLATAGLDFPASSTPGNASLHLLQLSTLGHPLLLLLVLLGLLAILIGLIFWLTRHPTRLERDR
jgi:hypothetical protein